MSYIRFVILPLLLLSLNSFAQQTEFSPKNRSEGFFCRDLAGGQMARDMTVFVDDDGKAYHVFSSEENATLHMAELTEDYTGHTGKFARVYPGRSTEASAIFKKKEYII